MPKVDEEASDPDREVQLLGNDNYAVMLTTAGSGYSVWRDAAVTRWREDPVRDAWGSYILLRDEETHEVCSTTLQPCGGITQNCTFEFADGHARYSRHYGSLSSTLDIAVAVAGAAELRRQCIRNDGDRPRKLSLTSYAELVLGPASTDAAHPAFSKMFVQTEWLADQQALLATRRHQEVDQKPIWAAHFLVAESERNPLEPEYETDRARFLGRGRLLRHAHAMQGEATLSGTAGCVLDPVFSLRQHLVVAPGEQACVTFWTALADSRDGVISLVETLRQQDAHAMLAAADTHARENNEQLEVNATQLARWRRWAGALLYADRNLRAPSRQLERGRGGAPVLWSKGISGDRPISLLRIADERELPRVQELLVAQRYWQQKHLANDVVLLNHDDSDSGRKLHDGLEALLGRQKGQLENDVDDCKCEVFLLCENDMGDDLRDGLNTVARLVLDASLDPLDSPSDASDNDAVSRDEMTAGSKPVRPAANRKSSTPMACDLQDMELANGIGGFIDQGRAYLITLKGENCTPQPWVNILANPEFGCVLSAEGGGYSWSLNSQQNAITPWPNDPVSDSPHDIVYLRDGDSGDVWSATALPIRVPDAEYRIEHGRGYSCFRTMAHAIETELQVFVPVTDSIKLSRLRLRNHSPRRRAISVTGYVEWALGANGTTPAPYVITSRDHHTGAVFACNHWRAEFADRVAFFDLGGQQTSVTGDRAAFLGCHGDVGNPAALDASMPLSGRFGAGLDPCGAVRTEVELEPEGEINLLLMLGDAESEDAARELVETYRHADLDVLQAKVCMQWDGVLEELQVRTPERSMDLMLNGWLLYQVLACRVWARTAYYQASGAYGYRDQLQDVMALCLSRPDIAREHLLRAAGRQFIEGDVQHWWLPPSGDGIRTRISDDRVWLPYVAAHYLQVTEDQDLLDVDLPFLAGPKIEDGKNDAFFQPQVADQRASVYEHCALALDSALTHGEHGLPLIGTGDWNDGLNRAGVQGRGESTWLGWFLLATIKAFTPHAEARGDEQRVATWREYASNLAQVLDGDAGWDGAWYRRGYYDDGTALGSQQSEEGCIDCIAQSWSVMASTADPAHAAEAMASAGHKLVSHKDRLARLFTPPFDKTPLNPGYIKGYPPGIRENGGQYTHGAIWSIFAWAGLGEGDRAGDLFALLNPVTHAGSTEAITRYKVEPYVSCADVYSVSPYIGRGGWTWYSGSGAWLYRAGVEAILGFHKRGNSLCIDPCIPRQWPGFELRYRHRDEGGCITCYVVTVENPSQVCRGVTEVKLDGQTLAPDNGAARVPLTHDQQEHLVRIRLGDPG